MHAVEDFLSYLLADRGYSQQTVSTYRESLTSFEIFFRSMDAQLTWENLDADVVKRWVVALMERGKEARTVNKGLSALRSFYKYLLRMERVDHDPTRLVKNPKQHVKLPVFLKQSEVDCLFDNVSFPSSYEGLRDRTVLLTFYHTGIRVSELVGLDRAAVHVGQGELKVTGKRNKQRIVPFGDELRKALESYLAVRNGCAGDDDALFLNRRKQRMTAQQVRAVVRKYLSLVTTQQKKSPHVLRHTFATAMLNNGADLEAIREILGHESICTTEVYTHTTFADLKKEYEHAHPRA